MSELVTTNHAIMPTSKRGIKQIAKLESELKKLPQISLETIHTLHGGVYTRTIMVPAGAIITGVMIKIPTTLIISGDTTFHTGEEPKRLTGYHVMVAQAGRKPALLAHTDTWFTMIFKTDAKTVAEAEEQFTDEAHCLGSRLPDSKNTIIITEV